jgi:hypothetical protein
MRTSGQKTKFKVFTGTESTRSNTVIDNAMFSSEHLYNTSLLHLISRGDLGITNFLHIMGFQVVL